MAGARPGANGQTTAERSSAARRTRRPPQAIAAGGAEFWSSIAARANTPIAKLQDKPDAIAC